MGRRSPIILLFAGAFVSMAGCGGVVGGGGQHKADSVARAEMARMAAVKSDSMMRDSLRRDSLMRDSLLVANSLTVDDFLHGVEFRPSEAIVGRLKDKGFEVKREESAQTTYDPTDPAGNDFRMVTDYWLADGSDPNSTNVSMRFSETYWPVMIDFVDDRRRDIFAESLVAAGFAKDANGNYSHPGNTAWTGAVVTLSGRRVVIERIWTY